MRTTTMLLSLAIASGCTGDKFTDDLFSGGAGGDAGAADAAGSTGGAGGGSAGAGASGGTAGAAGSAGSAGAGAAGAAACPTEPASQLLTCTEPACPAGSHLERYVPSALTGCPPELGDATCVESCGTFHACGHPGTATDCPDGWSATDQFFTDKCKSIPNIASKNAMVCEVTP